MTGKAPEFMKEDLHAGKENLIGALWWEELALYRKILGEERTLKVLEAQQFRDTTTVRGWLEAANEVYPTSSLNAEDLSQLPNPNVRFRALILARALDAALRILKAPDEMKSDLDLLLGEFLPAGAEKRMKAQKEALRSRGRSKHAIAKAADYDPSVFNREVAAGEIALLDYPDEFGD